MSKVEAASSKRFAPLWALLEVIGYAALLLFFVFVLGRIIGPLDLSFAGNYANSLREFASLGACLLAIIVFSKGKVNVFLNDTGLKSRRAIFDLCVGFLAGTILVSTMIGGMYLSGGFKIDKAEWPVDLLPGLVMFFLVALTEELVFRGYVFRRLERGIGTFLAIILSSLLFGFAHAINPVDGVTWADKIYFCAILSFEAGLPLAGAYLITRRLWLPIGLHWAWDFMEGTVYGFDVSGTDIGPSVLMPRLTGDLYTSGGPFGPEASLPAFVIGVAAGGLCLFVAYKRGMLFTQKG